MADHDRGNARTANVVRDDFMRQESFTAATMALESPSLLFCCGVMMSVAITGDRHIALCAKSFHVELMGPPLVSNRAESLYSAVKAMLRALQLNKGDGACSCWQWW